MFTGHETATAHDPCGCTYHRTRVVARCAGAIKLDSGGWRTATTKRRMNQWADEYGVEFEVYQRDFDWYVQLPSGKTRAFKDGMVFSAGDEGKLPGRLLS